MTSDLAVCPTSINLQLKLKIIISNGRKDEIGVGISFHNCDEKLKVNLSRHRQTVTVMLGSMEQTFIRTVTHCCNHSFYHSIRWNCSWLTLISNFDVIQLKKASRYTQCHQTSRHTFCNLSVLHVAAAVAMNVVTSAALNYQASTQKKLCRMCLPYQSKVFHCCPYHPG